MIVSGYIYSGHNPPGTFDHNLNTGEKFKWEKLIKKEVKEGGGGFSDCKRCQQKEWN